MKQYVFGVLGVAALSVITACAPAASQGSESLPAHAQASSGGDADYLAQLPFSRDERKAMQEYDRVRQWDPCALHDPAAAQRVTGQVPDKIEPGHAINECSLSTTNDPRGYGFDGWNFGISAGARFYESRAVLRVT